MPGSRAMFAKMMKKKATKKKKSKYPEFLSIIELGCGCGELSSSLQVRGHSVYGIDVNEAAIQKARAKADANLRDDHKRSVYDLVSMRYGNVREIIEVLDEVLPWDEVEEEGRVERKTNPLHERVVAAENASAELWPEDVRK